MLTITMKLDKKRSTASKYENHTAGVVIEAQAIELHPPGGAGGSCSGG